MTNKNDILYIPAKVNGLPLEFVFDTGASTVSISLSEATFMLKNGYLSECDLIGDAYSKLADGKILKNTELVLREIEIGTKVLYNVKAVIIHNQNAPLLLGQSVIKELGNIEISNGNLYLISDSIVSDTIYEKSINIGIDNSSKSKATISVSNTSQDVEQKHNFSFMPTQHEIDSIYLTLPQKAWDYLSFYDIKLIDNKEQFYYRLDIDVSKNLFDTDFVNALKRQLIIEIKQDFKQSNRILHGLILVYKFYSFDNVLLFEIEINKNCL